MAVLEDDVSHAASPRSGPRRSWWWVPPVLVPVLVFAPFITGGRLIAPGDGHAYNFPLQMLAADMWRAGILPGWNPYVFGGSPLLATSQVAAFYPPNFVHLILPPVLAFNLLVLSSFVTAGLGAALLGRRLTGDDLAGSVAGVAFGLSGFMFAHAGHHGMIAAIAWLPWVLWAADRLAERFTGARLAAGSSIVAMAVLAGHPQMAVLVMAVASVWALVSAVGGPGGAARFRSAGAVAAMGAGGVALAAVHVAPVVAILGETDRSDLSYAEAVSFSFDPSHLSLLGLPYLFGFGAGRGIYDAPYTGLWSLTELGAYVGAAAAVLAVIGLRAGIGDRRTRALYVAAVLALLVALGDNTPVARLVHALPVVGNLRAWGRYAVVVDLAVAMGAAHGVARLRTLDRAARRRAAWPALAVPAVLLLGGGLARVLPAFEPFVSSGRSYVFAVAVPTIFAATAVVVAVVVDRRHLGAALVVVVALDLLAGFGWFYEWRIFGPDRETIDALVEGDDPFYGPVNDADGGLDRIVFVGQDLTTIRPWFAPTTARTRLRWLNGYDPLAPVDFAEAVGAMTYIGNLADPGAVWTDGGVLLDRLRVTTVLVDPETSPLPPADAFGEPSAIPGSRLLRYDRVPRLADAFVVGRAEPLGPTPAFEAGREVPVGGVLGAAVRFDEGTCEPCSDFAGPVEATVRAVHGVSSSTVEVNADADGLLVVSRPWFPGWSATVDGSDTPIVRVDGLTIGVPVPPGRTEVELRYRPPGLLAGLAISFVAAVALGGLAWRGRRPTLNAAAPHADRTQEAPPAPETP